MVRGPGWAPFVPGALTTRTHSIGGAQLRTVIALPKPRKGLSLAGASVLPPDTRGQTESEASVWKGPGRNQRTWSLGKGMSSEVPSCQVWGTEFITGACGILNWGSGNLGVDIERGGKLGDPEDRMMKD